MPSMKKPLQLRKKFPDKEKNFAVNPDIFFRNKFADDSPIYRISNIEYWTEDYINRIAPSNFGAYYYGHLTNQLSDTTKSKILARPTRGNLYVHVESALTNESFRTYLRSLNTKIRWDDYYRGLLGEKVRLSAVALIRVAREYGLTIHFVSTTPEPYKTYVLEFLKRHKLWQEGEEVRCKGNWKQRDSQFLEQVFWDSGNSHGSQNHFFYDNKKYRNVGWNSLQDFF